MANTTADPQPARKYLRHLVTYRDRNSHTAQATVRIRDDVTDLAKDARRQLIGNRMSVSEILLVELDT
jgi:hypothetical protein